MVWYTDWIVRRTLGCAWMCVCKPFYGNVVRTETVVVEMSCFYMKNLCKYFF